MKKPLIAVRKSTSVPALLLIAFLLLVCGLRLYGRRGESVEAFAGENGADCAPQSLFALLQSAF